MIFDKISKAYMVTNFREKFDLANFAQTRSIGVSRPADHEYWVKSRIRGILMVKTGDIWVTHSHAHAQTQIELFINQLVFVVRERSK